MVEFVAFNDLANCADVAVPDGIAKRCESGLYGKPKPFSWCRGEERAVMD